MFLETTQGERDTPMWVAVAHMLLGHLTYRLQHHLLPNVFNVRIVCVLSPTIMAKKLETRHLFYSQFHTQLFTTSAPTKAMKQSIIAHNTLDLLMLAIHTAQNWLVYLLFTIVNSKNILHNSGRSVYPLGMCSVVRGFHVGSFHTV